MYYVKENDNIIAFDEDRAKLESFLKFKPDLEPDGILETEEGYTVVDFVITTDEEAQERARQKEEIRRGSFKLTKADFWIACLQLGITKAMAKEKIALIPDETLRAVTEIRLDDAEFFYRGDAGLTTIAKMFGVTDEQLDVIFNVE